MTDKLEQNKQTVTAFYGLMFQSRAFVIKTEVKDETSSAA
jgi:hypothetical protein